MTQPISIILPCYKAQDTLATILSDVLQQTYQEWELICISNGNRQEEQLDILQEWKKKDNRVKVISLPPTRRGVSVARNHGIQSAKGEWVCFVDADDRILPDHLSGMVRSIEKGTDVVYGGITQRWVNNQQITDYAKPIATENIIDAIIDNDNASAPYNVLIKRNLLNDLLFNPDYTYGEDAVFKYQLFEKAEHINLIPLTGYVYVRNSQMISAVDKYHENIEEAINEKFDLLEHLLCKYGVPSIEARNRAQQIYFEVAIANILTNPFHIGSSLSFIDKNKRIRDNFFGKATPGQIFKGFYTTTHNPFYKLLWIGMNLHTPLLVTATLELFYRLKYKKYVF